MRIFKKAIAFAAAQASFFFATAQGSQFRSIESPSMPTVSSPEIGNGFYSPGSVLKPEYNSGARQNSSTQQEKANEENKGKESFDKENSLQKKILSALSANDLSILKEQGFSSDINSIIFSLSSSSSSQETKNLLNKILTEIEKAKDSQIQNSGGTNIPAASENPEKKEIKQKSQVARMLRFSVNGYDILSTCRKIYISQVQLDGTFLVTGDRIYSSDGKRRTETFHILFKVSPNETEPFNYKAAANVTQDYLNENSFLYQLSKFESLPAMRVGDLVSMRTEDSNWKLELLIDLGEK